MIWLEIFCDVEDVTDPSLIGITVDKRWAIIQWQLDDNYEAIIDSGQRIIGGLSCDDAIIIARGLKHQLNASGVRVTMSSPNPRSRFVIRSIEYELQAYDRGRLVFSALSELTRPLTPYEA